MSSVCCSQRRKQLSGEETPRIISWRNLVGENEDHALRVLPTQAGARPHVDHAIVLVDTPDCADVGVGRGW